MPAAQKIRDEKGRDGIHCEKSDTYEIVPAEAQKILGPEKGWLYTMSHY